LTPPRARAYVQQLSRKFVNEILIAHNERSKQHFDMYRISLADGASTLIEQNDEFHSFVTDSNFEVRLARRYSEQGEVEYLHRNKASVWKRYALIPFEDSLTLGLIVVLAIAGAAAELLTNALGARVGYGISWELARKLLPACSGCRS
jgi:hypothetical protein